jgi:hypothetical protein
LEDGATIYSMAAMAMTVFEAAMTETPSPEDGATIYLMAVIIATISKATMAMTP